MLHPTPDIMENRLSHYFAPVLCAFVLLPVFACAAGSEPNAAGATGTDVEIVRKAPMDESGAMLGSAIDEFGAWLQTTPAAGLNKMASHGVSWLKLLASGILLLLPCCAYPLARAMIARHLPDAAASQPQTAHQIMLNAVRYPLYLLIWVCGIYWALTPLFPHFAGPHGGNRLHFLAGAVTDGVAFIAIAWFATRLVRLINLRLRQWVSGDVHQSAQILVTLLRKGLRLILPAVVVLVVIPLFNLSPEKISLINRLAGLFLIGAVSWVIVRGLDAVEQIIVSRHPLDGPDILRIRRIQTQANLLKKVIMAVVIILTAGSMLMVFDSVRQYGGSILASAGIAGLVIGVAAQRSIAGLLAGFQIAIAQPISIEDVVVVEGEWGRIEEITLTYVVVRTWDQRRLVLPVNYFIEKPFQNWTRNSTELLGSVLLRVDYTAPVGVLREELQRIVQNSPHWDGRSVALHVTDSHDHTLELRATASAADGSKTWDLRCEIREKLVEFLRTHHPESLPRIRTGLEQQAEVIRRGTPVS